MSKCGSELAPTDFAIAMGTGASGYEIEITPEMIEAGVMEYVAGTDWLEEDEDAVARIFRVMIRASGNSANVRRKNSKAK